jgi:flagellin
MISGLGISSGIASAVRTAAKARATMDTMARQIATGQKVSSAKDDGAAWARAAGLKSQRVHAETRQDNVAMLNHVAENQSAVLDRAVEVLNALKNIILQARTHPAGQSTRLQLQADWNATIASGFDGEFVPSGIDSSGTGFPYGVMGNASDPMLATQNIHTWHGRTLGSVAWLSTLSSVNIASGNTAALDAGLAEADLRLTGVLDRVQLSAGNIKSLRRIDDWSAAEIDRLEANIGSLTDADLGKASSARADAEARQQLAMQTVRSAITVYGNMASGLLGNVQRTQRGIRT